MGGNLRIRGVWRVGRLAGININLHWSFGLLGLWLGWQLFFGARNSGSVAWMTVILLALFGCVALHELAHAWTACRLGVMVKNVILLPFGGMAQIQALPHRPLADLLIAAAGPMMNFLIAAGGAATLALLGKLNFLTGFLASPQTVIEAMLQPSFHWDKISGLIVFIVVINLILFGFNMIPALPLDGGRVGRALLAMLMPYRQATKIMRWFGPVVGLGLLAAAIPLRNIDLIFVGLIILLTALFPGRWE